MKRYYPVFVDLEDRLAVVAGGGPEIAPRAEALLDVGARVRVVAARPSAKVRELARTGRVELLIRDLRAEDFEGAALAIVAGDEAVVARAREAATAARVPLNVVDRPEQCDWIHGAVLRRGVLVAAISTSGAAPALAVRIRDALAADIGPEYAHFLDLATEHRSAIARSGLDFAARRRLWYRIADSSALAALRDGDETAARAAFAAEIAAALASTASPASR